MILVYCLLLSFCWLDLAHATTEFDPTSSYQIEAIEGWQVYWNKRLLDGDPELASQVRTEVECQLRAIVDVVPADKVRELRKSKIWIERFHPKFPCACYHPSAGWLEENGFNPDKVDSVDISNARHFVEWTRQQPWMILHELAHGYHDQVLGHDHPGIREAFEKAKRMNSYTKVQHVNGDMVKHYALSNDQEYFAEITEAYFGKNDFFPFDREELKAFDPAGFKLMREIWGEYTKSASQNPSRP
jgi:hypothetical protein